jgi:hypothetical protein
MSRSSHSSLGHTSNTVDLKDCHTTDLESTASGGTFDKLSGFVVSHDSIFECRHLTVENRTNSFTRLLIGVSYDGTFLQKEAEESPYAANLYWTDSRIIVPPGARIEARLYGCTAGDKLYMSYEGYIIEV